MKKVLTVILAVLLACSLAACGNSNSPKAVTKAYMDGIKDKMEDTLDQNEKQIEDILGKDLEEDLEKLIESIEFEIHDQKIDGDKATVEVTIKTYDFMRIAAQVMEKYMASMIGSFFGDNSEQMKMFRESLKEQKEMIDKGEFDKEVTVTVPLKKENGKWVVDLPNADDFINDNVLGGDFSGDDSPLGPFY